MVGNLPRLKMLKKEGMEPDIQGQEATTVEEHGLGVLVGA